MGGDAPRGVPRSAARLEGVARGNAARRLSYSDALGRWDTDAILDAFAEDVVIHVAVHDAPMRGREIAGFLFGVLAEELGECA